MTDIHGVPVQYMMYAPYGEELLNQKLTGTYHTPYTFTDKERDPETGYLHFDARKYIDVLGIWIGPDRLLDKYIYNSPYVYCDGNPVKYVDPDGNFAHIVVGAVIGATITGAYTLYQGGSWSQVGAAALGGAVAGGITATTGGLASGLSLGIDSNIMASAGIGAIGGAVGSVAGNLTEQGINIAVGNQEELNMQDITESAKIGAILGGIGGAVSGTISGMFKKMLDRLPAKYNDTGLRKLIRNEIAKEQKGNGKRPSNAKLNELTNQRLETSQTADEITIKGAESIINNGIITSTTTAAENEDIF